jgi:hypothetical protein
MTAKGSLLFKTYSSFQEDYDGNVVPFSMQKWWWPIMVTMA